MRSRAQDGEAAPGVHTCMQGLHLWNYVRVLFNVVDYTRVRLKIIRNARIKNVGKY